LIAVIYEARNRSEYAGTLSSCVPTNGRKYSHSVEGRQKILKAAKQMRPDKRKKRKKENRMMKRESQSKIMEGRKVESQRKREKGNKETKK
jgi:hypothetical protein